MIASPNPYNPYALPTRRDPLNREPVAPDNKPEASTKGSSMSVQIQQFRVVGVNTQSGEDVSVVIDAATKAAAEVKAEKMHIETTHIARLKTDSPEPPDEHDLFSIEAAEALASNRTINLIEACVSHEKTEAPPPAEAASAAGSTGRPDAGPQPTQHPSPHEIIPAITRPSYASPASQQGPRADQVSGLRAFGIVLIVLFGISAGAYFVLVHQPNTVKAQGDELVFGQDLFSDVLEPATIDQSHEKLRDAFNNRTTSANAQPNPEGPPIALDQQLQINLTDDTSAAGSSTASKFKLQSVVTTNAGRFAVINGKLYKQGASIGSAILVSVADDWVLIERDGKQFTLQIDSNDAK